ncbi:MAG: gliding motility-associated C-terminal domain-containing protein [Flavobacteriaceae bacterium]|nr:gliding motility-associated C-terminal domain-containing protein [Flavobacteriaceae bacterium]
MNSAFRLIFLFSFLISNAQEIELYQQYNGRFDYIAIGNTMNTTENGTGAPCTILTSSSAILDLQPSQNVVAAYLYWAGSGDGDFEVALNGTLITAERTFADQIDEDRVFFAAFTDITNIIQNTGNTEYTLSELDLTDVIAPYCPTGTNFAGWSIVVIYEDPGLPLNQLNVYDGLESVSAFNNLLSFQLDNLNVIDNQGAKIGFLAWEGDSSIAVDETLQVNGNIISNPPLNPANNAFNSTNSFTNSDELWNMDIDFYDIQNNIQIGDTQATITLTSGQDFVMINNIITVLNSQLPDATIEIDNLIAGEECGNREVFLEFTVYNINSTDILPANTPIAFYANNTLLETTATINEIPIDGSESQEITLTIPQSVPEEFILKVVVDDLGNGSGVVTEIDETNNEDSTNIILLIFPEITGLIDLEQCDAVGIETFDLTQSTEQIDPTNTITFHLTEEDAENNENPFENPENYVNIENPQTIYVRVDNGSCFLVDSFFIEVISCPLPDATIALNNDLNACRQRDLIVNYTVANTLGTLPLPAQTPIAFYIDEELYATDATPIQIPAGGQIQMTTTILLSDNVPDVFELKLSVDDTGDGTGIVEELDETNNIYITTVNFETIPDLPPLPDMELCNEGFGFAVFDLTLQYEFINAGSNDEVNFYTSFEDAMDNINPIYFPSDYQSMGNPQVIYVRLDTEVCFTISSFEIATTDCPPWIPEGFSPNNDGINDFFEISGLLNIFTEHELLIYSRNGNLIFRGTNVTGFWDGAANEGLLYDGPVPSGLYYYVLNLNHPDFKPLIGWVYLNK